MKSSPQQIFRESRTEAISVALVSLALLLVLLLRTGLVTYDHPMFSHPGDWHKYLYMASHPLGSFHIAPYCWRIGEPMIAGLLPFDLQWNFLLISAVSVWLTAILMYYIARSFEFDQSTALVGMVLFFSLGFATKVPLKYFWLVDPLATMIMTAAIYALCIKKNLWFLVLLTLGVTVKESVIFVAPLYYSLNTKKVIDFKLAGRTLLIVLPAVAILLTIRWIIPQLGNDPSYLSTIPDELKVIQVGLGTSYNYLEWAKANGLSRLQHLSFADLHSFTIGTFGAAVAILPLFAIRQIFPLLVRFLPFLFLVYTQLIFAGNTQRLLVIAFPAVILFALTGISAISDRLRIRPTYFLALPLIYYGVLLIDPENVRMPFESTVIIICLAALFQLRGKAVVPERSP
jgi:hypothetical protein